MNLKIVPGLFLIIFFSTHLLSQDNKKFLPEEKYPADSLKTWTAELMKVLSESHPGFYRYTNKEEFDSIIYITVNSFTDSLNTIEYYRAIKPLIAQIGCLHTSINLSESYENYLNEKSNLIPIEVFIDDNNQVFITKNHSESKSLKVGSQLLSINGVLTSEILDILMNAIPSDGYNTTLKTLIINHRFAFWYSSMLDLNNSFKIEVKYNEAIETFSLKGVSSAEFDTIELLHSADSEQLAFEINDNIAVLTIKSFATSDIKNNGQNYKKYIKSVFKQLNKEEIENLIIDLRYNSGGTDGNAVFLTSHFFDKPFRYWDKIEVTEKIAKQIKGLNRIFYPKPVAIDSTYRWKGALLSNEFDYYKTQKPAKNNFKGNVFILTNGLCMSSCSDVVAVLSDNDKAVIVGQETGGGFQGNTSGMMPSTAIKPNMTLTLPLQKYTNAVQLDKNVGRGTIPDFIVNPTLKEWINKEDIEMKFVNDLIRKSD